MLLRRWNSKRDPAKRREILDFLTTPQARGMSRRAIARRFLVHHQLISELEAELQANPAPDRVDDSTSRKHPARSTEYVDDSPVRAPQEPAAADFGRVLRDPPSWARERNRLARAERAGLRFVSLHPHDECPRLGSGHRRVIIDSIGPKWVWLVRVAGEAPSPDVAHRLRPAGRA
jgi:hypothetical protein